MSNVLIIGDLHLPFTHPEYLRFCKDTKKKYRCTEVVFAGDIVDLCGLGFWDSDADGRSTGDEMNLAREGVAQWYKAFPKAVACIGNHDARTIRHAKKHGMPLQALKSFAELWGTPEWSWDWSHEIDGILYTHGTGSGPMAAHKIMQKKHKSVVIGHVHSSAGVLYNTTADRRMFAMNVGCGIDCSAYAFHYAKDHLDRPVLGNGVVLDGTAIFNPMPCGRGEKYHRGN